MDSPLTTPPIEPRIIDISFYIYELLHVRRETFDPAQDETYLRALFEKQRNDRTYTTDESRIVPGDILITEYTQWVYMVLPGYELLRISSDEPRPVALVILSLISSQSAMLNMRYAHALETIRDMDNDVTEIFFGFGDEVEGASGYDYVVAMYKAAGMY